ncbi:MAG: T9SS type A sorting domain-containing protein [Bacteroidetes bacterium]|nr:T9SS type A sorting domain-containing protein [Bacteroidota bacterium]
MKRTITILIAVLLLSSVNSNSQTNCDSISVDTAYVDAFGFYLTAYNSSPHFIVYPFLSVLLDANPYITLTTTPTITSFLSIPGDANNGYTDVFFTATVPAASAVPQSTLFTGILTITDPNDSTFTCSKPISFLYGNLVSSVNELQTGIETIFPNPSNGQFTIVLSEDYAEIFVTDIIGQKIVEVQTIQKTTTLQLDNNGVYLIYFKTKQGMTTRKLIVNR